MKVIDTRNAGGQLVILGDALVPPTSNTAANATTSPMIAGSLRYNPEDDVLQFMQNGVSNWDTILTPTSGNDIFLGKAVDTWQQDSTSANRLFFVNGAENRFASPNSIHQFYSANGGVYAISNTASRGYSGLHTSNSADSGFIALYNGSAQRVGYFGMANATTVQLVAEGGRDLSLTANSVSVNGDQLATVTYVNNAVNGLDVKEGVVAATTANITLSGAQTIDGITLADGNRVLVKDQTNQIVNGIYLYNSAGAWTRSLDMDEPAEVAGASVWVASGATNGGKGFVGSWANGTSSGVIGTDAIVFAEWGSWTVQGNASTINTGTLADARLTANVALKNDHIIPTAHNAYTLGSTSFRYQNVFAANVTANAATIGNISPTANAVHDIGGTSLRYNNVYAVTFNGVATSAQYADLAERYHADAVYEPGTVLVIGGEKEVTASTETYDHRVAGVVSTAPAYMMNSEAGLDATHPYIALRGRVPCKVVGTVRKGDSLVTSAVVGHAMSAGAFNGAFQYTPALIGKALEDFDGESGLIEVLV